MKKFLESLSIIAVVLTLSLADETGWVMSLTWIAVTIALVGVTVFIGGFSRGK
jgi:hypothetical protein